MAQLSAGQLVADKYRVEHVIGVGGMGIVVAATHIELGQPVAIKVLKKQANDEAIARFQREARLIVKLKSVHVARVFDVGTLDDETPYFVMERLEGTDLALLLQKRRTLPVEEAVDYVLEACEAVAEAHSIGVVHRDLKPANLFLARGPGGTTTVKVLDFGISKSLVEGGKGALTQKGVALGSPGFMAPEQIESSRDVDARADIYSVGAILYRLTSGRNPYEGSSIMEVLAAMTAEPLAPLTSRAAVPDEFGRIVEQCLAQDIDARPASIAYLAKVLAPFGSRRAKQSLEHIQATMGLDHGAMETVTVPNPKKDPDAKDVYEDSKAAVTTPRRSEPEPVLPEPIVPAPRLPRMRTPKDVSVRRPREENANLLPIGLALAFLFAIVGFVLYRRLTGH